MLTDRAAAAADQRRARDGAPTTGDVREGVLPGGLPYVAIGSGPPVVVLAGLDETGGTANPTGPARWLDLLPYRRLATSRTVFCVRRRPGIGAGTTMADLAAELAHALARHVGEPVDVVGVSTGGSLALQLALDHPERVRRLVLLAGACRLSERGRRVQREQARLSVQGRHREAMAVCVPALVASAPARLAMRALVTAMPVHPTPQQTDDLVRTIEAEDAFDVTAELHRVGAPTLVVGGDRDGYYGPEGFAATVAGIPDATLRLLPRLGHAATMTSSRAAREVLRFLGEPGGAGSSAGRRRAAVVLAGVGVALAPAVWSQARRRARGRGR